MFCFKGEIVKWRRNSNKKGFREPPTKDIEINQENEVVRE